MSTINSLMNAGSTSTTGNAVTSNALNKLTDQLSDLEGNTTLSDEAKQRKIDKINSQINAAASVSANIANAGNLINGMLGKNTDVCDFSPFFGTDLQTVKIVASSSMQTQKEARMLAAEINLDKIRGNDTSDKEAKLANMSENVSILNKGLNNKISNILSNEETDHDTRAIITQINDQLAESQKKLDKEFGNKYNNTWKDGEIVSNEKSEDSEGSEDKKTEETKTDSSSSSSTSSSTTTKTEPKPSVIDQINSGLQANQDKLDKEFGEKYGNTWENGSIVEDNNP